MLFNNIIPHLHDIDYVRLNSKDQKIYNKYTDNSIPYIAGSSGMANSATALFKLLDINMNSEQGKQLVEMFCAFIVGSGMHSYHEVYTSFNKTLKYLDYHQIFKL